jgi:hypothetical protein
VVVGVTAFTILAAATPSYAASVSVTLSAVQGPSIGGNTITLTAPPATVATTFSSGQAVEFVATTLTTCPLTYTTAATVTSTTAGVVAVPASGFVILNPQKAAVVVPAGVILPVVAGLTSIKYMVCVYSGTTASTSPLVANSSTPYTVAAKSTITSVSPTSGSAQGGTTVKVVGTNFPALTTTAGVSSITASIGGSPLNITSVASDGLSFTAMTPPHTAGTGFTLSVVTMGGTTNKTAAFNFTNGITITPNTVPNNRYGQTPIDVYGVGVSGLTFSSGTIADTNAHVYLTAGMYDPSGASVKANGEVGECNNVLVVSDQELICTLTAAVGIYHDVLNLNWRTYSDTTWTASTNTGAVTSAGSALSAGGGVYSGASTATFTSADIGQPVAGTGIPALSVLAGAVTGTTINIAAPAGTTVTAESSSTPLTIGQRTTSADSVNTAGGTTVSSVTGHFSAADIGRYISSSVIPPYTIITGFTAGSPDTITISNPTTAVTATALTISNAVPVPTGTYTLTVVSNGQNDVQSGGSHVDTTFTQSVISSGSTFTISDY